MARKWITETVEYPLSDPDGRAKAERTALRRVRRQARDFDPRDPAWHAWWGYGMFECGNLRVPSVTLMGWAVKEKKQNETHH